MRLVTDTFAYCAKEMPRWNTISISGYHISEAGATPMQELAFTLANGVAYVEAALNAGLAIDEFAPRLSFFFNCKMEFFEEIAKFRAARKMWAELMRDRFGARDPRSMMLRFHTQTAGSSLTSLQPYNNVVRTAVEAMAAVLGGTQSLHTNSFDEALALPTEFAATLALRTQQGVADRQAGGGGPRADDRDRRHGWVGEGDRIRLDAAPDRGLGLSLPAGGRERGSGHRRRQSLPRRHRGGPGDPAGYARA
jgi:methylmalonyl-CoA mutase N-terminal domain/subunit